MSPCSIMKYDTRRKPTQHSPSTDVNKKRCCSQRFSLHPEEMEEGGPCTESHLLPVHRSRGGGVMEVEAGGFICSHSVKTYFPDPRSKWDHKCEDKHVCWVWNWWRLAGTSAPRCRRNHRECWLKCAQGFGTNLANIIWLTASCFIITIAIWADGAAAKGLTDRCMQLWTSRHLRCFSALDQDIEPPTWEDSSCRDLWGTFLTEGGGGGVFLRVSSAAAVCQVAYAWAIFSLTCSVMENHGPAAFQGPRPVYDPPVRCGQPAVRRGGITAGCQARKKSHLWRISGEIWRVCIAAAVESTMRLRLIRWEISKYFHFDRSTTKIREITPFISTCHINSTVFHDLFCVIFTVCYSHLSVSVSFSSKLCPRSL